MNPALILAQASTTPIADSQLATGLKLLALGLAVVALLVTIWDKVKAKPPASELYATKPEVEKLEKKVERTEEKIDNLRVEIVKNHNDLQRSDEARTSNLHNRLNSFQETLRVISEKVGASNAS